ncbi:hypothetical protein ACJX0J_040241, partial [Zea mays]
HVVTFNFFLIDVLSLLYAKGATMHVMVYGFDIIYMVLILYDLILNMALNFEGYLHGLFTTPYLRRLLKTDTYLRWPFKAYIPHYKKSNPYLQRFLDDIDCENDIFIGLREWLIKYIKKSVMLIYSL